VQLYFTANLSLGTRVSPRAAISLVTSGPSLGDCAPKGGIADSWNRWLWRQPGHSRRPLEHHGSATACASSHRRGASTDRSRRRPVLEGVCLADRARQTRRPPGRSSGSRPGWASMPPSSAPRASPRRPRPRRGRPCPRRGARRKLEFGEAVDEYGRALSPSPRADRSSSGRHLSGEAWARMHNGDVRAGIELLARARASSRAPRSPTRTAQRSSSASASALPDLEHRHRRLAFRRGACADRSLPAPFRPPAREHPHVARALLPPPARLRGSPGGHRGRPRAGRRDRGSAHPRRGVSPGLARRRARRPLGSRAHLRGARQGAVRGSVRSCQRRAAAQQPRRPRVPARPAGEGDRAPERGVRGRPRPRHGGRRGDGGLVARTGVLEDRRSGWGREPGA
jgi:hypothetical protein